MKTLRSWGYGILAFLLLVGSIGLGFQALNAYREPTFRYHDGGGLLQNVSPFEAKRFFKEYH